MLKIHKQETYEGCLPICLLILENKIINKQLEREIIYKSLNKRRDNFYALNVLSAFSEMFSRNLTLFVGINDYAKYLNQHKDNSRIQILHQKINLDFLLKIKTPYIVQIDDFALGDIVHAMHYLIVEKIDKNEAVIIDPWYGSRTKIKNTALIKAIEILENHLLFSPLLISFNKHE